MKTLLVVFAHPDDESFSCAGTIAKYVDAGWEAHSICATKGEAGESGPYQQREEALGNIRQKELEAAGIILGISSVTFLGYKDGTLAQQHAGELEDKIYRHMTEISPDVVITFEPNGISNHPDHSKICLSTTYAFQKYAASLLPQRIGQRAKRSFTETTQEQNEPKLYYACMPEQVADYLKKQKNIPAESFGKPWIGIPDKLVTTVIDVQKFRTKKIEALRSHISQTNDVERFLSLPSHPFLKQEYFILRMQGIYEVFMGKSDRISNRL